MQDKFDGPNAIISINKDPIGAARVIAGIAKEVPSLKLKAGYLGERAYYGGRYFETCHAAVTGSAFGKTCWCSEGPADTACLCLSGNLNKLVLVLNSIKNQKEQQA